MLYILDRSVDWGKPTFKASHGNVINGAPGYAGVGMGRSAYLSVLSSLEKKGAIIRKPLAKCTEIGINFKWNPEDKTMLLPVPKRKQSGKQDASPVRKTGLYPSGKPDTEERELKKESTLTGSPSAHRGGFENSLSGKDKKPEILPDENCNPLQRGKEATDTIRDRLTTMQSSMTRKTVVAAEVSKTKKKPNAADMERVFVLAMKETFPDINHVRWGKVQKAKVKRAMAAYSFDNTITLPALIDWGVRNWKPLLSGPFSFMTNACDVPSINYLLSEGVTRLLASAYASKSLKALANDFEVDELTRLKARGMTEEEALAHIGEARAARRMREENEKIKRDAANKLAQAADREDRAARLEGIGEKLLEAGVPVTPVAAKKPGQVWGGQAIPHPDSPAMREKRRLARAYTERVETPAQTRTPRKWEDVVALRNAARGTNQDD
jgi:hypothetical protein